MEIAMQGIQLKAFETDFWRFLKECAKKAAGGSLCGAQRVWYLMMVPPKAQIQIDEERMKMHYLKWPLF
jgi:hypothetical protein